MQALRPSVATAAALAPGVALSAIVAVIGYVAAPYVARVVPIPNMVIALVVGIALNPLAARPAVQPGMDFCVKTLLRWAVALLGLRVGLGDIAALGCRNRDFDRHRHGGDRGVRLHLRALERGRRPASARWSASARRCAALPRRLRPRPLSPNTKARRPTSPSSLSR